MKTAEYVSYNRILGYIVLALLSGLFLVSCGPAPVAPMVTPAPQDAPVAPTAPASGEKVDYVITAYSAVDTAAGTQGVFSMVPMATISDAIPLSALPSDLADADAIMPLNRVGEISGASLVVAPRARVDKTKVLGVFQLPKEFELSDNTAYIFRSSNQITSTPSLTNTIVGQFPVGAITQFKRFAQPPEFGIGDICPTCDEDDPDYVCPKYCPRLLCWLCEPAESFTTIPLLGSKNYVLTQYAALTEKQRREGVLVLVSPDGAPESAGLRALVDKANMNTKQSFLAMPSNAGLPLPSSSWAIVPEGSVAQKDVVGTFAAGDLITVTANSALVFTVGSDATGGASNNATVTGRIDLYGMRNFEIIPQKGSIDLSDSNAGFPLTK